MDINQITQWADEIIERAELIKQEVSQNSEDYIVVRTGAELQAALNDGGLIKLDESGSFIGNFVANHDDTFLVGTELDHTNRIESDEITSILQPGDTSKPVFTVTANKIQVNGVKFQQGNTTVPIVVIGSAAEPLPENLPTDVHLDQVHISSTSGIGKRGVECNSRSFTLIRSLVTGFMYQGADSQAFWGNNGPGPFLIEDNELSGSGENIMFGGDRIKSEENHPSNATIRNNLIIKPQDWRSKPGSVKNSLEFKAMKVALVEGNLFDGCWKDSQPGNMIVFTPRNQYGDNSFVQVCDITFRNNKTIRHTDGKVVSILYQDNNYPTKPTSRITIEHNLFQDSVHGIQLLGGCAEFLKINNNTLPNIKWTLMLFDSKVIMTPLEFKRNVCKSGEYGTQYSGQTVGKPSIEYACQPYDWTENVIEKTAARNISWPTGNTLLEPGQLAPNLDSEFKYIPDPSLGY